MSDEKKKPKLRNVDKTKPPYPLNDFPKDFGIKLGKELIYLLSVKGNPSLEGEEWEEIFANCIRAKWKPSNIGLDDVVFGNCAWGAKTVKASNPSTQKQVRLISGRNSPIYSFGETQVTEKNPDELGEQVLSIWNERVLEVKKIYGTVRTVVLVKSQELNEVLIFEFDTVIYNSNEYYWNWNERKNLEGYNKLSNNHIFTWQPHGSQFTIIENIPDKALVVRIKKPPVLNKDIILNNIGFNEDWISVYKRNG